GRAAEAEEARILAAMLARQRAMFPRGEAERFLSVGEVPRDAALDATEHAALAAVCLAIFNLDEAMTRG
ncbi:MAG: hypothetical protein ACO3QC_10655, partial [Phycisphaerales bacterium]